MVRPIAAILVGAFALVVAAPGDEELKKAEEALGERDFQAARDRAAAAVRANPKNPAALSVLGVACLAQRDNTAAADAFAQATKLAPQSAFAHDRLGDAYLKLGRFADAVAAFDASLKLDPEFAPEHWRRGIALYYAGRYADGAKQFETHKKVNPEDVENAAWHYLCNAKVVGREKARKELITVTRDARVPMAEIQKLFAGAAKPTDVLAAADAVDAKTEAGKEARFYAHLYLGLWLDSAGDAAEALQHLRLAADKYKIGHYMWDVAAAHVAAADKAMK